MGCYTFSSNRCLFFSLLPHFFLSATCFLKFRRRRRLLFWVCLKLLMLCFGEECEDGGGGGVEMRG